MKTRALTLILLSAGIPGLLSGQQDDTTSRAVPRTAFEVKSASVSSGYYTSGTPIGFEIPQSQFLGPTAMVSAGVLVGGQRSGEKSSLTWNYSPSYFSTVY